MNVQSIPTVSQDTESVTLKVLVVDDTVENRDLLTRRLTRDGHDVEAAADGRQAVEALERADYDLVLLDIMMPEMDGYEVLDYMRADTSLRDVTVVVVSALTELESIARCIELGADDFLTKPFNRVLLRARVNACMQKKKQRQQEQAFRRQLDAEKKRADDLLHALFPYPVLQELKASRVYKPRRYENVAILFCDVVGFTTFCDHTEPEEVVALLQRLIEEFEQISKEYELEKIKTIGDALMAACGLLRPVENPVLNALESGLAMIEAAKRLPPSWDLRVGIHVGPVVAGIVGKQRYAFDMWGDAVNTAARVESNGQPAAVNLSEAAWQHVAHMARGQTSSVDVKGKGQIQIVRFKGFKN